MKLNRSYPPPSSPKPSEVFELFVQNGFSDFELAAIITTLQAANNLRHQDFLSWRLVSNTPGLLEGEGGTLVRANPAIPDHFFADRLIVVGGQAPNPDIWMKRARAMRRKGRAVVLLSSAATAFIKASKQTSAAVTTHWHDVALLHETGDYPNLSGQMAVKSNGIITSAGSGYTVELVINLISDILGPDEVAEIANRLLLAGVRSAAMQQPSLIGGAPHLFDQHVQRAIQIMEAAIAEPLSMVELADKLALSARQLERKFNLSLKMPPARFYKQLRAKRARALLRETKMHAIDVAMATGFSSTASLSRGLRDCFGQTSTQIRSRASTSKNGLEE